MIFSPEKLLEYLGQLNILAQVFTHPALKTVEDSKRLRGEIAGAHTKNLFLKDKKKKLWLVVCHEDRVIDLKELKMKIGSAHLSFAKEELLIEILGVRAGSVSALCVVNDHEKQVQVVLDQELMKEELINCHPLTNEMTLSLRPDDLRHFLKHRSQQFDEVAL